MRLFRFRPTGLFLLLCMSASYAEPTYVVRDIRYLNFDKADNAEYVKFDAEASWDQIEHWARNRGVNAVRDREPFVDNRASFVNAYGSTLKLSNLNQNANYSLFIDFVCYTGNPKVTSKLVISIKGKRLATLVFGETPVDRPFELVIPRDLCYDGTAEIQFDEFATTPGSWGVWDMVLSSCGLPLESIRPKKVAPEVKEPQVKVVEPGKKKGRKSVKPETAKKKGAEKKEEPKKGKLPDPAEKKEETPAVPPVQPKRKEPTIVEPNVVREPEIKGVEVKKPSEPKTPSGPDVKAPADIRDVQ